MIRRRHYEGVGWRRLRDLELRSSILGLSSLKVRNRLHD